MTTCAFADIGRSEIANAALINRSFILRALLQTASRLYRTAQSLRPTTTDYCTLGKQTGAKIGMRLPRAPLPKCRILEIGRDVTDFLDQGETGTV
jgi:hypothetical protein